MKLIQNIGLVLFVIALLIFTAMLGVGHQTLTPDTLGVDENFNEAVLAKANERGLINKQLPLVSFISEYKSVLKEIPEIQKWQRNNFIGAAVKSSAGGPVQNNPWLWFLLTFGLGSLGGLLFILPKFLKSPGIKNNGIYHNPLTRGIKFGTKQIFWWVGAIGIIVWGFIKDGNLIFPIITVLIAALIFYLSVLRPSANTKGEDRSASPIDTGWLGIIAGVYFIGFYILLYWASPYINNWVSMVDPLSQKLNGGNASQWFLYGFMYCVLVLVMGIRMMAKYIHNKYQIVRTFSVILFQIGFAFLIPQFISKLNVRTGSSIPAIDLKNIWPLNYDLFAAYNMDTWLSSSWGMAALIWGIALIFLAVPLMTYFFGKRWYCSWVCGCGGLAETMGDPYRQLSDKSLKAWRFERYIIHGVMVAAAVMTILVLVSYTSQGNEYMNFGIFSAGGLRSWYGFLIGAGFAGVVGTGFYPIMGNRVWCRFGCPLAGYLGLVQKFKSKFRITTNGGQCISCGNCSTYCEMGIDVRSYAQRGQDIVRSSCVGCGVCSAVCPRGVLRLENSAGDVATRTDALRTVHITADEIKILS